MPKDARAALAQLRKVTAAATQLVRSLTTSAPPRNREEEARKARERAARRFG
ncbi:MAG: hypothetical protein ACREMM_00085 [Gemmatimonadales bacterium]